MEKKILSFEQKIDILVDIFPYISRYIIAWKLEENNEDIQKVTELLLYNDTDCVTLRPKFKINNTVNIIYISL